MVLALSPDQFQTVAFAWISALSAVAAAIAVAIVRLWPVITDLEDRIGKLFRLHNENVIAINSNSEAIAEVSPTVSKTVSPSLVSPKPSSSLVRAKRKPRKRLTKRA